MPTSKSSPEAPATRRPRRWSLLVVAVVGVVVWLTFVDSHSILKRVRWHQELEQRSAENEVLRKEVKAIEEALSQPVTDEVIEQIAREEYGMRRPGETVYRVEE